MSWDLFGLTTGTTGKTAEQTAPELTILRIFVEIKQVIFTKKKKKRGKLQQAGTESFPDGLYIYMATISP